MGVSGFGKLIFLEEKFPVNDFALTLKTRNR
jgi:hypothetical protein